MTAKHQTGATVIVALVALIVLTLAGMATMGDLLLQSTTIRNEQFRQQVFYAASSELNAIVGEVNNNGSSDDDPMIETLLDSKISSSEYQLDFGTTAEPTRSTTPDVLLQNVLITARRNDLLGCSGESVGKVKVLAGEIIATARLNDGKPNGSGIRSTQQQRYVYCWP